MSGPWDHVTLNEAWDGYIPTRWNPPTAFSQRGYWEWWRCGVIEGRVFGTPVTDVSPRLYEHDRRMAEAYDAGLKWVWRYADV
jgi:hypothetical protein